VVDDAFDPAEQITEAMLLEKLMSDEADEAESELDTTLKRPAVALPQAEEAATVQTTEDASAATAEAQSPHSEMSEVVVTLTGEPAQAEINEPADSLPPETSPAEIQADTEQESGTVEPTLAEQTQETLVPPSAEEVQHVLQGSPAEATPGAMQDAPTETTRDKPVLSATEPTQATPSGDLSTLAEDYTPVETTLPLDTASELFPSAAEDSKATELVVSEPAQVEPLVEGIQSNHQESMNIEQPDLVAEVQEPQEATEGVLIESAPEGVSGDEPPTGVVITGEEVIPIELDEATAEIAGAGPEHATEEEQAEAASQAEVEITPSQFAATPTAESTAQVEQADAEVVAMPANETVEVEQLDTIPVPVQENHSSVEAQVDEPTLATAEAMEHSDLPSQEKVADTRPTNTFTVYNWTPDESYQGEATPQRKRGFFQWFFDLFRSR
jgi:hypothetical protein